MAKEEPLTTAIQTEAALDRVPQRAAVRRQIAADDVLKAILDSLDDSKAEEIVSIDIAGKSALADYMVVATGRSQRHVGAIADHLSRDILEAGGRVGSVEGMPHCDWVLIDAGDVIVHVFGRRSAASTISRRCGRRTPRRRGVCVRFRRLRKADPERACASRSIAWAG